MRKVLLWIVLGAIIGIGGYKAVEHLRQNQKPKQNANEEIQNQLAGFIAREHAANKEHADGGKLKTLMEQVLKEKIDGKEGKVTILELEKPPQSASAPHRHPGPVFGYVIDGELEWKIDDGPVKVLKAGEVFYEPAGALHAVSRNPSKTKPVRFLAIMLTDKDEKRIVLPEKK